MYNSVVFSIFPRLCNHYHFLIPECSHPSFPLKETSYPVALSPVTSSASSRAATSPLGVSLSQWICPFWTFHRHGFIQYMCSAFHFPFIHSFIHSLSHSFHKHLSCTLLQSKHFVRHCERTWTSSLYFWKAYTFEVGKIEASSSTSR